MKLYWRFVSKFDTIFKALTRMIKGNHGYGENYKAMGLRNSSSNFHLHPSWEDLQAMHNLEQYRNWHNKWLGWWGPGKGHCLHKQKESNKLIGNLASWGWCAMDMSSKLYFRAIWLILMLTHCTYFHFIVLWTSLEHVGKLSVKLIWLHHSDMHTFSLFVGNAFEC